jgi:hypothetical protein
VRTLSEYREARDRSLDRGPRHHLQLPRNDARESVFNRDRAYRLRGSEVNLLETIGQYRAVFVDDLSRETSDPVRLEKELESLQRQQLVVVRSIARLDPEETADVVAVTQAGQTLLDDHRDPESGAGQRYYVGWIRPADLWHDASLYHMVRDVETEIDRNGGEVMRVVLDDELKGRAFAELHHLRKDGGMAERDARELVAALQALHIEDDRFVFPDVRLEFRNIDGEIQTMDLELVTRNYRAGHLAGKSNAGFRMFRSGADSSGRGVSWKPSPYLE